MDNKTAKAIKSLLASVTVILLYFIATIGIVKLFWNTPNHYRFEGRIKFSFLLLLIVTLFLIFIPYHFLSYDAVTILYYAIIIFHGVYLLVGTLAYILINK